MAKKRIPKYGIIDILAQNLVKYRYFSIKLILFDKCHRITHFLQFTASICAKRRLFIIKW